MGQFAFCKSHSFNSTIYLFIIYFVSYNLRVSTMVLKLVATLVVPFALMAYAATPHPHPVAPHHAAPHHPAPHHPAPPYCLEDPEYPEYDVANKISQDPIFLKKYSDVADQSADDLVENIIAPQEAAFNYDYYTGASKGPSPYDATHWIGPEGYLCPSTVEYAKIKRAVNVEGYWRIVLQHVPKDYAYGHYNYTQTARLETCQTPDSACRLLAPCYHSKCTQKYVYHRMLSLDPCDPYRGFFIDTYKLPSACSCHIPQAGPPPPA